MARDYIVARLEEIGLDPVGDAFPLDRERGEGMNVLATVRGTEHPERYLVLTAHFDHLGVRDGEIYNGADDNTSGTAGLLALADRIAAEPLRHSVIFAFLDAEEGGLQGARHLVASPPVPLDRVLLNLNLDMVGHSEGELWVVGTTQYPFLRPVVETVTPLGPVFLSYGHDTPEDRGADNWVMASDHAAFHREGIPFLYFGVSDHPDYHQPTDEVATLGREFYPAAVATIGRIVDAFDRALDGARPTGTPGG